jgi:ABC-2 type transport system ATP-binding protein
MRGGRLVVDARIAELSRTDGLRVTVAGDAAAVLAQVPGVRAVREDGSAGGDLRRYRVDADAAIAPALTRALTQAGLALHALEPNRQDLETVFARINSATDAQPAAAVQPAAMEAADA